MPSSHPEPNYVDEEGEGSMNQRGDKGNNNSGQPRGNTNFHHDGKENDSELPTANKVDTDEPPGRCPRVVQSIILTSL